MNRFLERVVFLAVLLCLAGIVGGTSAAADPAPADATRAATASADAESTNDERGRIIIEARTELPKVPDFYTAHATAVARIDTNEISQEIKLGVRIVQGTAVILRFGLNGEGDVTDVLGDNIKAWSVRREGSKRFLDIHPTDESRNVEATIKVRSAKLSLPTNLDLTHLTPGESVGFNSVITLEYADGVRGKVVAVEGFAPLSAANQATQFQTATGGKIVIALERDSAAPGPIELTETSLEGELHPNARSVGFTLRGTAHVRDPGAEITILAGIAAASRAPAGDTYRLRLALVGNQPVYKLVFPKAGTFPFSLEFVAALAHSQETRDSVDFTVASGAVVPMTLKGLEEHLEFQGDQDSVVPHWDNQNWVGFLPATGRVHLRWKATRKPGEGKLFFTTTARIEATVGAGLLRQLHQIHYQILQGDLGLLRLTLNGPGEILEVQGKDIIAWKVTGEGDQRQLDVTLSQPMSTSGQLTVRSQTPLGAFPVRVAGLRLTPLGAIRHSGHLRLTNVGAVRLEPTGLQGLSQLTPDQFPAAPASAKERAAPDPTPSAAEASKGEITPAAAGDTRQTFVYRFPSGGYAFTIAADRIQPEVNIAHLIRYEVTDTDRVIRADIELDIRDAPIREWSFGIPYDYSIVSVTGAGVTDYIAASETTNGSRQLKVIFGQDVAGRQLVSLHLEKNEVAAAGDWLLPKIAFPDAKSVQGDIGIMGARGFRIGVKESDLLVEKPLSYFPQPTANLQQAFRIREPGWSATMVVEQLERSVQADVFHLYSLSQETIYGSALINYFITGAPVSEWRLTVPETSGNVMVDGKDVRTWRRDGNTLVISLHQPVMESYTLLITFEEKPTANDRSFSVGQIEPLEVNGERGFVQVASPQQIEITTLTASDNLLTLDPLELPAEFRLLSTAPSLGTWQYTQRPFKLDLQVTWFDPGTTVPQVVEFSEAHSRVSQDGEVVTDVVYYVKSRGQRALKIELPGEPARLWEASVNGQPVTARQTDGATLIPLSGAVDANVPVEVRLRLGKPSVSAAHPTLALPVVHAPVLKTEWNIHGDEQRVLVPGRGTVSPSQPVPRPSGFDWVAQHGMVALLCMGVLVLFGASASRMAGAWKPMGLVLFLAAAGFACYMAINAFSQIGSPAPLQLSLPILSAGETVEIQVANTPLWRANYSWIGVVMMFVGAAASGWSFVPIVAIAGKTALGRYRIPVRALGVFLIGLSILFHGDAAWLFFGLLAIAIFSLGLLSPTSEWLKQTFEALGAAAGRRRAKKEARKAARVSSAGDEPPGGGSVMTTMLLAVLGVVACSDSTRAATPEGFEAADTITQEWQIEHEAKRLTALGQVALAGKPGDRFVLLRAPAVLTHFDGPGLRLTKVDVAGHGLAYVISIPKADTAPPHAADADDDEAREEKAPETSLREYKATFRYQLEALNPVEGIKVFTGPAAMQEIDVRYDAAGWEVAGQNVARIASAESDASVNVTRAKVLLGLGDALLYLAPKARDVTAETTQFFVEGLNLYTLGPGVVDGRHRLHVRTSQGQVGEIAVQVPRGLTVSAVDGPVGSWQFDADSGRLLLAIEPTQSATFDVVIDTQRGLDPLPVDVKLAPLTVAHATGQLGMLAIAFGPDAQPERVTPTTMSAVNPADFDASELSKRGVLPHRVYRYGQGGGEVDVRAAPVDPEVRVVSSQVLSLGEERVVLNVNFAAEISRAGLFQISFVLPEGLEVESLSGPALHHWSELLEQGTRRIIMHLNGKTIGTQKFSLALTGPTPSGNERWSIPRFELTEATRQIGNLVIRPTAGIRLRTVSRQNASETDPRAVGVDAQGALAFRLLQRDWELVLGIENLEPWVTGQVLHEVTLREGQTRSAIIANFQVDNASIRTLRVALPITNPEEVKTIRATGNTVSDFVRTAPDANTWDVHFKRRMVGKIDLRIEYERRGGHESESESARLNPAEFPQTRQLSYYFSVRTGGRLDVTTADLARGWQQVDWNTVPPVLRESGNRSAPALALRAVAAPQPLTIQSTRHEVADALKLRVSKGVLTTVLSPNGDQLTAVDLTMDVIQRSSLSVGLPVGGELFSIFVNGESVNSIRRGGGQNAWQFYILPGIDDRTAEVRFVYSMKGQRVSRLQLVSPQLNVPLEDINWSVVAPMGFELTSEDGNLELVEETRTKDYNRESYLAEVRGKQQQQAQQAAKLLEQANQLLQAGEQTKARWAFNNVANLHTLDAASNEDARVQLQTLQTQQAVVGLNTRRQRLYLDNESTNATLQENQQLREAAAGNPILQHEQLNFRPQQLSQLLGGNTTEDNANLQQIAGRLVQHQRTTEPAPQAIVINLPEGGTVYDFRRTVQVSEAVPLELNLTFRAPSDIPWMRAVGVAVLVGLLAVTLASAPAAAYRTMTTANVE